MENNWQNILEEMPLAFCLCQAVKYEPAQTKDYRLLELNQLFQTVFAQPGQDLSGLLLAADLGLQPIWLDQLEQLPESGVQELPGILSYQGRWFVVSAGQVKPDRLVLFFKETPRFQAARSELQKIEASYQKSLAASLALAQLIFDHSPSAIITYQVLGDGASSSDYIVSSANPACRQLENWQQQQIIGRSLAALRPGVDSFGIVPVLQKVWQTGQSAFYPATVYNEAGLGIRWFENTIFRLPSGEVVAVYHDVSQRQLADQVLAAEREKLKVTLLSISDGVITTDSQGRIEMLNPAAENLTGWSQLAARGQPLTAVLLVCDREGRAWPKTGLLACLSSQASPVSQDFLLLQAKNGASHPVSLSAAPIKAQDGSTIGSVLVFKDMSEEQRTRARLDFLSDNDLLTGLYNRSYIEKLLPELEKESFLPLTVLMGDLDGLKMINDAFGPGSGDKALVRVAQIIASSLRQADLAARWGGDEFLILLPRTSEEEANQISANIKAKTSLARVGNISLSISLGHSTRMTSPVNWPQLFKSAEDGMNKAKLLDANSYRNTVLQSIRSSLNEKSQETQEHGSRIGHFCRQIGLKLGLKQELLDELEVFSLLHDVGKIGIDDRILQKPGRLTGLELDEIKKHPQIGSRIVSTVPELRAIAGYILAHHERWDGKGYPNGLSGSNIPLPARILAVADAYDAMTQDRPYRKAMTDQAARQELQSHAASQFDPQIVNIFLSWLDQAGAADVK